MAKVKKISAEQFLLDFINKQYEVCGSNKHFDTFKSLVDYSKEYDNNHESRWFEEYTLTNEQYEQVKQYYLEHFYDYKPKSYSKQDANNYFSWSFLEYGFPMERVLNEK